MKDAALLIGDERQCVPMASSLWDVEDFVHTCDRAPDMSADQRSGMPSAFMDRFEGAWSSPFLVEQQRCVLDLC